MLRVAQHFFYLSSQKRFLDKNINIELYVTFFSIQFCPALHGSEANEYRKSLLKYSNSPELSKFDFT